MKGEESKFQPEVSSKYLEQPIALHPDMTLTEEDIESRVPFGEVPHDTLVWKSREGFPTYHLNPATRLLIVYLESGPLVFKLKEDSELLRKYIEKYGSR